MRIEIIFIILLNTFNNFNHNFYNVAYILINSTKTKTKTKTKRKHVNKTTTITLRFQICY